MSGHSKWSKVKHQKAITDAAKAKAFTKASRAITIAVKEGGGIADPDSNFRLRLVIEQAKAINMPKETIERAIAKAKGDNAQQLESLLYEAYGPEGVAFIIVTVTDNRQRTTAAIKNILDHHGATLVSPGSVMFQFEKIVHTAQISYRPIHTVEHSDDVRKRVEKITQILEELEDVQKVYTNLS